MTFPLSLPERATPHPDPPALANELHAAGHLRVPAWPPVAGAKTPTSRWILALQTVGGWLAAIFLLLFLGAGAGAFIDSAAGWIVIGVLMSAGVALPLMRTQSAVLRQFLFVVALAGHGALIVGAAMIDLPGGIPFIMLALYEAALLVWVAWMPHRLVAALIGCGALVAALPMALLEGRLFEFGGNWWVGLYWLAACLLWLWEPRWLSRRHAGVVAALACALALQSLGFILSQYIARVVVSVGYAISHFDMALLASVNAAVIVLLARALPRNARNLAAVALLLAALALTWKAPAVGMGGVALALGFARGRSWLMWLGGAVLVFGIGWFYYDLQLSLLYKSGLMILGGGLLLAVRALFARGEAQ